jgi:type I restriction enzyme, S subunit
VRRGKDVPDGWKLCRLDEVSEVIDSLHQTPSYQANGVPMVRVTDVKAGFLDLANTVRVSETTYQQFTKKYTPQKGDIVFGRVGTYGVSSLVNSNERFCLGQNTAIIVPKINERYLYYSLQSPFVKDQIEKAVGGSTQKTISLESIKNLGVLVGKTHEVDRIASILGALDDKIECNRRINQTLEAMARALYKHWFVDFGPFRGGEFVESELGKIPQGWHVATLDELCYRVVDRADTSSGWANESLIDLRRMPRRSLSIVEWGRGEELTTSVTHFEPRDILFGAIRPYFHKVGIAPTRGVTNTSVFAIRPHRSEEWSLLACICFMDSTIEYATKFAKGTKMPVVAWSDFVAMKVPLPPDEVRHRFCKITSPWFDEIIANVLESRNLAALRDYLLPKLLSGEVEVEEGALQM